MSLWIGLMSGTSMDGIDAALLDDSGNKLISALTHPYSSQAKQAIADATLKPLNLGTLSQLSSLIGSEFADAVDALLHQSGVAARDIVAIGSHGQTIAHAVNTLSPYTIQVGCPHTIAERSGITVVADFRTRDVVLGGQGAPLAPLYHQALFGDLNEALAIINIGGISNITFLSKDGSIISGYDVGPGNCLMDAWVKLHLGKNFDDKGRFAADGKVIPELLQQLLSDPFYSSPAPKSLCTSVFALSNLESILNADYLPEDVQATFLELTVSTINSAIQKFAATNGAISRLIVCGGGTHNEHLMGKIQRSQISCSVISCQELGVNSDYLEAMMIAWLAYKALYAQPVDLGVITGAKKTAILGAIFPKGLTS